MPSNWQRIPGVYIWKNIKTGSTVGIHGSPDVAWYVVKLTIPKPQYGYSSGTVATRELSPYFVLNKAPVGEYGRSQNQYVRMTKRWRPGTLRDALEFAMRYLRKRERKVA